METLMYHALEKILYYVRVMEITVFKSKSTKNKYNINTFIKSENKFL